MAPSRFNASQIRNKIKREEIHRAAKREKKQDKLKRRLAQAEVEKKNPEEKIVGSFLVMIGEVIDLFLVETSSHQRPKDARQYARV